MIPDAAVEWGHHEQIHNSAYWAAIGKASQA